MVPPVSRTRLSLPMKSVPPLLYLWLALLPGLLGVCVDPAPIVHRLPSNPAVTKFAPDLCISAGHTGTTRPSVVRRQPACEEEESSESKDLSGSTCLSTDLPDLSRVSSQATLRHWDVAHTAPRFAILRC
jgi:hypothetical protein